MKQTDQSVDKKTQVLNGVASFLTRYRRIILSILIVIAVGTIGLVVALSVQNSRVERALEAVETLQEEYREWSAAALSSDPEESLETFSSIENMAGELIDRFPGTYASVRAQLILAEGNFTLENWTAAAELFATAASEVEGSYLASVASMAAGVARENAGDAQGALEHYRLVAETTDPGYGFTPRALFSIGRIEEGRGEIVAASQAYQSLIDDYPASSWTNLARNRIITLTVEGRIGE
mgnify:CR=1 FL=1